MKSTQGKSFQEVVEVAKKYIYSLPENHHLYTGAIVYEVALGADSYHESNLYQGFLYLK